jgi:hypothetical protein
MIRCGDAGLKETERISRSCAWVLVDGSCEFRLSQLSRIIKLGHERVREKNVHHKHLVVPYTGEDIFLRCMPIHVLGA